MACVYNIHLFFLYVLYILMPWLFVLGFAFCPYFNITSFLGLCSFMSNVCYSMTEETAVINVLIVHNIWLNILVSMFKFNWWINTSSPSPKMLSLNLEHTHVNFETINALQVLTVYSLAVFLFLFFIVGCRNCYTWIKTSSIVDEWVRMAHLKWVNFDSWK